MRPKNKILFSFCIAALLFLGSLIAAGLYAYYHPSIIKPLIEKAVSRYSGMSFTIRDLSYSLKPLNIRAKDILLRSDDEPGRVHLKIAELHVEFALAGPWGHKRLVLEDIRIDGFSIHLSDMASLGEMTPKGGESAFFDRVLRGAIALFLFRDIKIEAVELLRGNITAQWNNRTLSASEISANLSVDHLIGISCKLEVKGPTNEVSFSAPSLRLTTDRTISLVDPEFKGRLIIENAVFQSHEGLMREIDVNADLLYNHQNRQLALDPLSLHLSGATLWRDTVIDGMKAGGKLIYRFREAHSIAGRGTAPGTGEVPWTERITSL